MPMFLGFIPVGAVQRPYLVLDVFDAFQGEHKIPAFLGLDQCNIFHRHEPVEAFGGHTDVGSEFGRQDVAHVGCKQRYQRVIHAYPGKSLNKSALAIPLSGMECVEDDDPKAGP